jgi:hypothetical protein
MHSARWIKTHRRCDADFFLTNELGISLSLLVNVLRADSDRLKVGFEAHNHRSTVVSVSVTEGFYLANSNSYSYANRASPHPTP